MGLGGGHTQFHPKAALGLHLPAQLPTPRSPPGAYTLTQVRTHVLTKAAGGCRDGGCRDGGCRSLRRGGKLGKLPSHLTSATPPQP